MPRFTTAPVVEVVPKRRSRQPSMRSQIQREYQEAVRDALLNRHEALVVELDANDKPLTVRNRIKRAAERLGLENVTIRRRRDRIVAYQSDQDES